MSIHGYFLGVLGYFGVFLGIFRYYWVFLGNLGIFGYIWVFLGVILYSIISILYRYCIDIVSVLHLYISHGLGGRKSFVCHVVLCNLARDCWPVGLVESKRKSS